jgi:hypothetical protein
VPIPSVDRCIYGFGGMRRKGKYRKKKQENVEKKIAEREISEMKNIELGKRRK